MILVADLAFAQTGVTPGIATTGDAFHYHGGWYAGSTETASLDIKDSAADSNGYVNSVYVGAFGRLYEAGGFTSYGGYGQYTPTKTLAALIKATNIPADSFRVYVRGGIGETIPTVGSPFVTGFAGAGASLAITSSGSVVWNTVYAEWQNPGIVIVKSGLEFYLTGTNGSAQSSARAKLRRVLALRK
jgi:hypothetical protein